MNFRLRGSSSIVLMSLRQGAPYSDRFEEAGRIIIYEGHDIPRAQGGPDPKEVDQPEFLPSGKLTQNGLFLDAVRRYKLARADAELVQVFEKIRDGIWVYNGLFRLLDGWHETSGRRQVFKFKLEIVDQPQDEKHGSVREIDHDRVIPSAIKLEVWKRDKGCCVKCGNKENLHFDHIIPYSQGGSSRNAKNIQILCSKHNLQSATESSNSTMVDLPRYLSRISYSGPTDRTLDTLRALHRAHMYAVPFENLDISLRRKIVVDEAAILIKVVNLRRGGFCYELNCAFAALLRALGFQVTMLSARVARANGGPGPEFDHLALRVDLNQPWLADVGFGDTFLQPLLLEPEGEQADPAGRFRLVEIADRFHMEKAESNGNWKPQYSFSLEPRRLEDFADMCHYHQTSPDSSFTQKRICSLATPEGRITLADLKLVVTRNGDRQETILSSEEQRLSILSERFGISL